jgi:hypothetical protein
MLVVQSVLQEELERRKRMLHFYEKEVGKFPKGSIVQKTINGNKYFYLQHRDGKRIKTHYVPKHELPNVMRQIEERKKYQGYIKNIKKEISFIQKALKIKV